MKSKKFDTYLVVRLEKDEEIIAALRDALVSAGIKGGFFYGLGVGKELELGYYDAHMRSYIRKKFPGEYEFTSFAGNISIFENELIIHCHVTITDADFNAFGGHLFAGTVPATLEVIGFLFTEDLLRKQDKDTGLNLLEL
jgi:predicted DNA-binding protein with PD1-like motif